MVLDAMKGLTNTDTDTIRCKTCGKTEGLINWGYGVWACPKRCGGNSSIEIEFDYGDGVAIATANDYCFRCGANASDAERGLVDVGYGEWGCAGACHTTEKGNDHGTPSERNAGV